MTSEAIRLEGVTKRFGDFTAVDDISLTIPEGEFFSLLGPSGCGKTTTLRMLAGFEVPTEGRILLHGEAVENVPPYERDTNMVFQSYALFDHLDIERQRRVRPAPPQGPEGGDHERVAAALELVDMTKRASARTDELSGGQRQRIALARALVNRPKVLLLDEPLGALDLKLRRQMQVELKQIQREVGITFVFVTHDQEEALSMSDRIAVMTEGRVAQCGPPEEVYENPTEQFVAGFIGISNLLEGTVEDGGTVRIGNGTKVPAPLPDDCSRRRCGEPLGPPREDRRRRARGGHGEPRGDRARPGLPGHDDPGHRGRGPRQPPGRARAGHLPGERRRPLGAGTKVKLGWHPEHCPGAALSASAPGYESVSRAARRCR